MPAYSFCLRTPDHVSHVTEPHEAPDLRHAMIAAHGVARTFLHEQLRRSPLELHGSLDVEDERRQPVARILLADLARQIS